MSDQNPRPDFRKHPGPPPASSTPPPAYGPPAYGPPAYGPPAYAPAPLSARDERLWGMLAHLSTIAAHFVGLPFLGPLIVFLVLKDRSTFVREHAGEALNMNISLVVYEFALFVVISVLTLLTLGIGSFLYVLMGVPWIVALVFSVLAAVAANSGRQYRYPLIFRLVR